MNATVQPLSLAPGQRVLAVSDIHANHRYLDALLRIAGFGSDDALILLGDMVEKGYENLATLRYVMALMERCPNVHAVLGNCDSVTLEFLDWDDSDGSGYFPWYFGIWKGRSLLSELAEALGLPLDGPADYPALRAGIRQHYAPEIAFLRSLPTILESERVLFVHGGVPSEVGMEELDAWHCMKNDNFLSQDTRLKKWCVVGHWPVTLYREKIPSSEPIIAWEKHIISIDGGCSLKVDGQLNLLEFHAGQEDFSWRRYDEFPTVTALEAQRPSADSINIRWHDAAVEVLERGEEFCCCRHKSTGWRLDILSKYLYQRQGETVCEDSTDYKLEVEPGDTLSAVEFTTRGLLAKKDGVTGWYFGRWENVKKAENALDFCISC